MINCTCIVQEGQSPDQNREKLLDAISGFTAKSLNEEAKIAWIQVAAGNGFTEGKPSTSSVVSLTANEPLSTIKREAFLRELVDLWTHSTGCSVDEIVAVVSDPI